MENAWRSTRISYRTTRKTFRRTYAEMAFSVLRCTIGRHSLNTTALTTGDPRILVQLIALPRLRTGHSDNAMMILCPRRYPWESTTQSTPLSKFKHSSPYVITTATTSTNPSYRRVVAPFVVPTTTKYTQTTSLCNDRFKTRYYDNSGGDSCNKGGTTTKRNLFDSPRYTASNVPKVTPFKYAVSVMSLSTTTKGYQKGLRNVGRGKRIIAISLSFSALFCMDRRSLVRHFVSLPSTFLMDLIASNFSRRKIMLSLALRDDTRRVPPTIVILSFTSLFQVTNGRRRYHRKVFDSGFRSLWLSLTLPVKRANVDSINTEGKLITDPFLYTLCSYLQRRLSHFYLRRISRKSAFIVRRFFAIKSELILDLTEVGHPCFFDKDAYKHRVCVEPSLFASLSALEFTRRTVK